MIKPVVKGLRTGLSVTACDEHRDIASAALIETRIDEAERRAWFLFEAGRR